MKRDFDLIRNILFALESTDDFPLQTSEVCSMLENDDFQSIAAHLQMLESGGLITGKYIGWKDGSDFLVHGITYAGHDYIAAIRNDNIFNKAVSQIKEQGLPMTLSILKEICLKLLLPKL